MTAETNSSISAGASAPDAADHRDFIREIVAADLAAGRVTVARHPLPARAQRLPPHRPRQVDLPELRHRPRSSAAAATSASTTPTRSRRSRSTSTRSWRTSAGSGFDWGEHLYHASDYFEQLYDWAVHLIEAGHAYVDDQSADEIRETPRDADRRRAATRPGATGRSTRASTCSPGCGPASSRTAPGCCGRRIDMASPNINLRDPVLYRIVHATHPRTGDAWCIYPTYDFAHGQSDAIEGVTHSTVHARVREPPAALRLADRAPAGARRDPGQYEFARLNLTHTVLSKRVLLAAGRRRATSAAGTTRGCRRSRACGGAASRPRGSATSRR